MRYIKKGSEPVIITDWKEARLNAGQSLAYDEFDYKRELNDLLRIEQKGLCCYCQRRIDHFQKPLEKGAHNEHLYPEHGAPDSEAKQMDYNNIFACCIDSQGNKIESKRHCGEAKGNMIIREFIKETNCSDYFRYNAFGEIIPNGDYARWSDYDSNCNNLPVDQKEAFDAIKTLNLNCHSLTVARTELLEAMFRILPTMPVEKKQEKLQFFLSQDILPEFIEMIVQYMK